MMPNLFCITEVSSTPTYAKLMVDLGASTARENPWQNTPFEHYYLYPNAKRGHLAEELVEKLLFRMYNIQLTRRTNTSHDRNALIFEASTNQNQNCAVEVKVSLASNGKHNVFIFNHIALSKNFDRLILLGINRDDTTPQFFHWMSRTDIQTAISLGLLKRQQGGEHSINDDYMLVTSTKKIAKLHNEKLLRTFNEWN